METGADRDANEMEERTSESDSESFSNPPNLLMEVRVEGWRKEEDAVLGEVVGLWGPLPGAMGVNIIPLGKPESVAMTVMRAIEDTNPLCTAECTNLFGDGAGRCRQHDNTNGLDVCWAHSIHNVTGAEYCSKGLGVLVFEAIEERRLTDPHNIKQAGQHFAANPV